MRKLRVKLAASSLLLAALFVWSSSLVHAQTTLEWMTLTPLNEGFSIKLPVKPDEETDRVTLMGNAYKMRLYTAIDESDGMLYMVVMQEFPSIAGVLTPAKRLDQFMEGFKEGLNKSLGNATTKVDLQPDRDLELKGKLGRQFKLVFGETHGLVRAFDVSPRVYVLLVMGADEKNSRVVRFLESFEVKPAPPPVPLPVPPPPMEPPPAAKPSS
jgi:hypothetical protein